MNLAIIPARGGSKRIPRKNIKLFCGKPIVAWSIEAAIASGCFDRVIVSTDDEEVAAIAGEWGAETPFVRPKSLADDYADTTSVIAHAINWQLQQGENARNVCCLYATAPFIRPHDLKHAAELLAQHACDYVFSVTRYAFPIERAFKITPTGRVEMFAPENFSRRSQDLDEVYHDAGQFYWGKESAWREGRPIFSPRSVPLVLPRSRVQDIDTSEDWERAELMFQAMQAVKS